MEIAKKGGYIEKFLKKADNALQEGVKKADKVLDNAVDLGVMTVKQADKTSKELRKKAKKESVELQRRGVKIKKGLLSAKNITLNTKDDLETLKKLGKLRTSRVITEKEFQAKKKEILDRI